MDRLTPEEMVLWAALRRAKRDGLQVALLFEEALGNPEDAHTQAFALIAARCLWGDGLKP